jgi:hypothetical protein
MDLCDRHRKGDWIELNAVEGNTYVKLDVLSRCDYLLGAASGFSLISNLMRTPDQAPGLLMHSTFDLLESREFQKAYPNYVQAGGGVNSAKVPWAYQHPIQGDFLLNMPHTNEQIAKAIEFLMSERAEDLNRAGSPVSRWRVPANSH